MCAIIGSFDPEKLGELIELNSHRGNHSYSLLRYNYEGKGIDSLIRGFGTFDFRLLQNEVADGQTYFIAHTQAPTTSGNGFFNIHPSEENGTLLYHNGILKEDYIKKLQRRNDTLEAWDTKLLHKYKNSGYDLSNIEGTFSCLYYDGNDWFMFRNEISPLFIDKDWNISSTKFKDSSPTTSNKVGKMDFNNNILIGVEEFTTKENPYYFG